MQKKSRAFYYFIFLVVLYIALTIAAPPNKAVLHQYHISATAARLISTSVVIPVIGIWFAAFYGFAKLSAYAQLISQQKDGQHVATIARGISVLAFALPVSADITGLLNLWAQHHPIFTNKSTIIGGYVSLVLPLIGFVILSGGTRRLLDHIKKQPSRLLSQSLILFSTAIGVMYCYFVFTNKHVAGIYHMPVTVLAVTIVIPYLFMWIVGLLAATELYTFASKAPGIIYRQGWQLLAAGLAAVIISSATLQYLVTLTNRLTKLKIGALLAVVYVILLILASGYVTIAFGAKKLQKIEEV